MSESPNDIIVSSLKAFVEAVNGVKYQKDRITVFRGHNELVECQLKPLVYREPAYIGNEPELIRESIARAPDDFSADQNLLERLVRLQHYGLPSRLLDVTFNALTALFFSRMGKDKNRGEVIIFSIPQSDFKYFDSDTVALLSSLSHRPASFNLDTLPNDKTKFNEDTDVLRLVHDVRADKPGFEAEIEKHDLRKILCVQPKLSNKRIARQDGAFLLFGIDGKKTNCPKIPGDWIYRGLGKKRIVVTNKRSLTRELSRFGIAKHTLFPELDEQTAYVTRRFKEIHQRDAAKRT